MCSLQMNMHESYIINFVIFNSTIMSNRYLCQSIIKCLFKFTKYALQHLQFHQIHMQFVIDGKNSLIDK
jgi:hypothetical protein